MAAGPPRLDLPMARVAPVALRLIVGGASIDKHWAGA